MSTTPPTVPPDKPPGGSNPIDPHPHPQPEEGEQPESAEEK